MNKLKLSGLALIVSLSGCKIVPRPGVLIGEICTTPYDKYPKNHLCYEVPETTNYNQNKKKQ